MAVSRMDYSCRVQGERSNGKHHHTSLQLKACRRPQEELALKMLVAVRSAIHTNVFWPSNFSSCETPSRRQRKSHLIKPSKRQRGLLVVDVSRIFRASLPPVLKSSISCASMLAAFTAAHADNPDVHDKPSLAAVQLSSIWHQWPVAHLLWEPVEAIIDISDKAAQAGETAEVIRSTRRVASMVRLRVERRRWSSVTCPSCRQRRAMRT